MEKYDVAGFDFDVGCLGCSLYFFAVKRRALWKNVFAHEFGHIQQDTSGGYWRQFVDGQFG